MNEFKLIDAYKIYNENITKEIEDVAKQINRYKMIYELIALKDSSKEEMYEMYSAEADSLIQELEYISIINNGCTAMNVTYDKNKIRIIKEVYNLNEKIRLLLIKFIEMGE